MMPETPAAPKAVRHQLEEMTDMKLDKSVAAVVTGGASGLGRATAEALAAKGVKVALFDMNQEAGEALAAQIGGVFCKVNVTSDADVDAGFAKARAAHGQERVLINCAGIANGIKTASRAKETGEIKHFPLDAFESVVQVNLIGTFRCIAKSAAGMLSLDPGDDGDRGAIVCTASVAARGRADRAGRLFGLERRRRRHDAADRARPDGRKHPYQHDPARPVSDAAAQQPPDNVKAALAASVPYPKRLGRPEEYAALAVHLIENGYFNGECIRLDGAIRLPPR